MPRFLSTLTLLAAFTLSAPLASQEVIDNTDKRNATFYALRDMRYSVLKAGIPVLKWESSYSAAQSTSELNRAITGSIPPETGAIGAEAPAKIVDIADVTPMYNLVKSIVQNDPRKAGYIFFAPAAGTYKYAATLTPTQKIEFFEASGTPGGAPSASPCCCHWGTASGQAVLPKGVCGVVITNTSGNAGTLNDLTFTSNAHAAWTYDSVPVAVKTLNLADPQYLPTVYDPAYPTHRECDVVLSYPANPGPVNLDCCGGAGTVTPSSPVQSGMVADPLPSPRIANHKIVIYGEPSFGDPESHSIESIFLDFDLLGKTDDTGAKTITFHLKRNENYHTFLHTTVVYLQGPRL
jgi:hypothetical protein